MGWLVVGQAEQATADFNALNKRQIMLVGTGTSKGKQPYLRMVSQLPDQVAFGACHKESTVQFTCQQLAGSLGSGQGLPIAAGVIGIHADCLQEGRKQHTQAAAGTADGYFACSQVLQGVCLQVAAYKQPQGFVVNRPQTVQ